MFEGKITIMRAIILVLFVMGIIGGLIVLKYGSKDDGYAEDKSSYGIVNIWGTVKQKKINNFLFNLQQKKDPASSSLVYRYVSEDSLEKELLNAIADGNQPDLLLLSNKDISKVKSRLEVINESFFSFHDLNNKYVNTAKVFSSQGDKIIAIPLFSDPMMMYYNMDIYLTNSLLEAPKTWSELKEISLKITNIDVDGNINISGVALGSFSNVLYSKEFLLTLLLQSGVNFNEGVGFNNDDVDNLISSAMYYSLFSKKVIDNKYYSWNDTLVDSITLFTSSRVATIFAPYSYNKKLRLMNPNLNFMMAEIPHVDSDELIYKTTYSDVYGVAAVKGSRNSFGAYKMLARFKDDDFISDISKNSGFIPVKKSLLKNIKDSAIRSAIYAKSALITDDEKIENIFRNMLDKISNGRDSSVEIITSVINEFKNLNEDKK